MSSDTVGTLWSLVQALLLGRFLLLGLTAGSAGARDGRADELLVCMERAIIITRWQWCLSIVG